MIVDDRLETVLRTVAAGPGAAATQMRQLIDLLGRTPAERWTEAHTGALDRLDSLVAMLGEPASAALVGSIRLRSPILVEHLAEAGPKVALAAITSARLSSREWLQIIPDLPVQARGFLRHRRDLGPDVDALLNRLGITDFALPLPPGFEPLVMPQADVVSLPQLAAALPPERTPESLPAGEGISAIIARIEAFRRARGTPADSALEDGDQADMAEQSRLPFAEEPLRAPPAICSVDLALDAEGTVIAADTALASALVGLRPFVADPDAPAACDPATLGAARARLPIAAGRLELEGPGAAAGAWRIDAVPGFAADTGHFTGWHARLRRPPAPAPASAANDDAKARSADRLRQMLHELRTPINAVQGFAELIQQQMLGPTPHQYRSLAASIASDAARMLAGFEDVERLALLESASPAVSSAPSAVPETDLGALLVQLIARLEPVLAPREAAFTHDLPEGPLPVAAPPEELERTWWRLLSLIASAAAPGERIALGWRVGASPRGYTVRLALPLPARLTAPEDAAASAADSIATPGGMLGSGFALRLCAAELGAAGGGMVRENGQVFVTLPLLTAAQHTPSQIGVAGGQAG